MTCAASSSPPSGNLIPQAASLSQLRLQGAEAAALKRHPKDRPCHAGAGPSSPQPSQRRLGSMPMRSPYPSHLQTSRKPVIGGTQRVALDFAEARNHPELSGNAAANGGNPGNHGGGGEGAAASGAVAVAEEAEGATNYLRPAAPARSCSLLRSLLGDGGSGCT